MQISEKLRNLLPGKTQQTSQTKTPEMTGAAADKPTKAHKKNPIKDFFERHKAGEKTKTKREPSPKMPAGTTHQADATTSTPLTPPVMTTEQTN